MTQNRKIIYLIGFIFSLPIAFTSYINSSFLENYINNYYISFVYVVASILSILTFLEMPKLITRFGNKNTILLGSILTTLCLISLALNKNVFVVITSFILFFIANGIIFAVLDIFIEDFSLHTNIGKFRGFYLMIINAAWVFSQIFSGFVIEKYSYTGIYLLSSVLVVIMAIILFYSLRDFTDPKYTEFSVKKTVKYIFNNKHISRIYLINLILKFFFAWMIIYTPIYMHQYMHFNWEQIGFIFTIMLLPFVFLSFPLGKLSDTLGEKNFLKLGFLISACSTILIPIITTPKIWVFALILFMTRVGAATIEVMSESYFFKTVNEENADVISFFRNTTPVSYIIAPIIAMPILYFVSFSYIFFVLGGVMLGGYLITSKLEDIK